MSSDFSKGKRGIGSVYPERAYDSSAGLERVEPLLTASDFVNRFFWGLPLTSPITNQTLSNKDLQDYIKRAACLVEIDAKVDILPVLRRERLPFDPNMYHQYIYCEIPHKPIQKVLRLAICSASYSGTDAENEKYPSGAEIFKIPAEWIEMAQATRGILNVNPINPAFSAIGTSTAVGASGATILQFIGHQGWVPAYWTVEAVFGFCSEDGHVPVLVNEAIGKKAAMLLIDNLVPLYKVVSHSLGIDGVSQSVADQAGQLLSAKRQVLHEEYRAIIKQIKVVTGNTMFSSNV